MSSSRHVEIMLGPPGTGKTAELTNRARRCLEDGISTSRIGFVSFSRAAVSEALDRLGGSREEYPWFRTIHALGYALAGIKQEDMLTESRLLEFSVDVGEPISSTFATGEQQEMRALNEVRGSPADVALGLYARAYARDTTPAYEFRRERDLNVSWDHVQLILEKYETFKRSNKLWDFSDLVVRSRGILEVDICFIDEAQDTTRAQWNLLRRSIPKTTQIVLAGDDDQCIYRWSGADPTPLGTLRAERTVLQQSYRVPFNVHFEAIKVAARIPGRIPKSFSARSGDAGIIESITDLDYVNLLDEGSWLLLARTRHAAKQWRAVAHYQGVVYQLEDGGWSNTFPEVRAAITYWQLQQGHAVDRLSIDALYRFLPTSARVCVSFAEIRALEDLVHWNDVIRDVDRGRNWWDVLEMDPSDAGYVRALRRNGESLDRPGRVRICTVHRAKGLEADNVGVLMTIPRRVALSSDKLGDELRVLYVALTRARKKMILAYVPSPFLWSIN